MASKELPLAKGTRHRALAIACLVLGVLGVTWGCTSTQKGDGSESHFVSCSSDEKCAEFGLGKCVAAKCEPATPSIDASTPSLDGAPPEDSASQCGPGDPPLCVDECGHDYVFYASCSNGVWTCPAEAPLRVDECPFICGGGPLPPCCGTYGAEARICPDGAQSICPTGTYETMGSCPDCAVADPKLPLPYAMTFRFTNASGKNVSIWHGCNYEFELTACASGYSVPVDTWLFCSPICPDTNQVVCGACYDEPAPVSASAPVEYSWDGYLYSNSSVDGRPCAAQTALPATKYRIKVPVYPDAPPMLPTGGYEKVPLYSVTVDFTTSPNGVVEIPIDQGA